MSERLTDEQIKNIVADLANLARLWPMSTIHNLANEALERGKELEQVTRGRDEAVSQAAKLLLALRAAEAREQALRETLEHGLLTLESARAWLNAWCEHGPIEFGGEADLGIEIDARIRHFINAITTTTPAEGRE